VGARFSAPVQTGSGSHPASYKMRTGFFPGVKRPGRGVDHPSSSSAEVKEKVEPHIYSTLGPSWPVIGRTFLLGGKTELIVSDDNILISDEKIIRVC
jgi:hypothetical protein